MRNKTNQLRFHIPRMKAATRACLMEARRTPGFGLWDTLHGYIYGRWAFLYISIICGEHRLVRRMRTVINLLFRALNRFPADNPRIDAAGLHPGQKQHPAFSRKEGLADTYHGKVLRLASAKKIVTINKEIYLTGLEQVLPYQLARDIVLRKPDRIAAMQCPCRASRPHPCLPLDVCLIIGEPFFSVAMNHHADKCRPISSGEACAILEAEARRGHVHHAFFKEATLGRLFAICNCCDCCCGAMHAHRNGIPMLASSGYISVLDHNRCSACGECVSRCPFGAARRSHGQVRIDPQACMGCGVCAAHCKQQALSLKRDHTRSDPLELDRLLAANPSR